MSTGINNVKVHTNYIYKIKTLILFILLPCICVDASGAKPGKNWIIVIDAGHGGKDPGALGAISCEKDITLPIALKTGKYIEENIKNVTVIYTRKSDTFVEVRERALIANRNKADLFISIHANWAKVKDIKGTETFIMGLAKDQQNLEVAMKENEVILLENDYSTKYEGFDPKSSESYIMFTLMQNIFQEQSSNLASKIQTQYKEKINRTDRSVKQAGFWVLFMTSMPSVLTETGFITNPSEERYLNSNEGQDYIASSIFRACRDYINEIDSRSGISTVSNQEQDPVLKNIDSTGIADSYDPDIRFKVQIATSSSKKTIKPGSFKGLTDVTEIELKNRYKYVSGSFSDYISAINYKKMIRDKYPDAFVIAVKANKIVPLQEALDQIKKN